MHEDDLEEDDHHEGAGIVDSIEADESLPLFIPILIYVEVLEGALHDDEAAEEDEGQDEEPEARDPKVDEQVLKVEGCDEEGEGVAHVPHADEAVGEEGESSPIAESSAHHLSLLQAVAHLLELSDGHVGREYCEEGEDQREVPGLRLVLIQIGLGPCVPLDRDLDVGRQALAVLKGVSDE